MVLSGKDGWLFLSNDTNRIIGQITGEVAMPDSFVSKWEALLEYRRKKFSELNIRYFFNIAPNKECVYQDFLPDDIKVVPNRPVSHVLSAAKGRVSHGYFIDDVKPGGSYGDTYAKGDTHWNHVGAFIIFNRIMEENGLPRMRDDAIDFPEKQIPGDLSSKIGQTTMTRIAAVKNKNFKMTESNGINNIGQRLVFENEDRSLPRLVMFRDSFTTHQVEMFAAMFSRVVFLWQPNIDYAVVKEEKPDFVFSQQIERFLVNCPDDIHGPSSREYEARKRNGA